jgi:cell division protein FtsQ
MTPTNRRVAPARGGPEGDEATTPTEAQPPAGPNGGAGTASARSRARLWGSVRAGLGVVLVAGASLAMAWGTRTYVTTSARFALTRVEVRDGERQSASALVAESGLLLGANVFSLDLDAARARILTDPWIAEATVSRRLPGTVVVRVVERKPAALVAIGDTFLATAEGEPFKRLEAGDPIDLPLVTGLTAERFAEDREDAKAAIRRAIDLGAEYEQSALGRRAPLEEVHVDPSGEFALVVGHGSVRLDLGPPPFRRKLDEAARVVAELDRRRVRASAILLDNRARPERVVVRLR